MPALCFTSNFVNLLLNLDALSHWNTIAHLNTPPFLYIVSSKNVTSLAFLVVRALVTLHLNATSAYVNMYLCVIPKKEL